jgi:hypothetical protein
MIIFYLEFFLLRISGWVNGWGASVARPAIVGVLIGSAFMILYRYTGVANSFKLAAMKAFDVTLLFGYTKHASTGTCFSEQVKYAANAFLGLWWYAIFVPTVINRISRVR